MIQGSDKFRSFRIFGWTRQIWVEWERTGRVSSVSRYGHENHHENLKIVGVFDLASLVKIQTSYILFASGNFVEVLTDHERRRIQVARSEAF
jgi:hypothetical protein